MKKFACLFLVCVLAWNCEKVVNVDLPTEPPKLVIEATGIQKEQDSTGILTVKLTETAPFFQDTVSAVSAAQISVETGGETFPVVENSPPSGIYFAAIPMVYGEKYTLHIAVNGEKYEGTTQLYPSVPIDYITQEEGIFDTDEVQIKAYFTDPVDERNYYYFQFLSKHGRVADHVDDEYFNGNQVSTFYTDEFNPGDSVRIKINGAGKQFDQYIGKILGQSGQNAGNPFATAPATIRGNMVNLEHPEKFPLGYFRLSQEFETIYTVE